MCIRDRADIIEKLFSSFYVEKQGASIVPTSKGMQLIKLVPQELKLSLIHILSIRIYKKKEEKPHVPTVDR